ncbi:hypothetical protein L195_g004717, partial [Trifolium pratense]
MPFGLCNAPATFQATMNDAFRPLLPPDPAKIQSIVDRPTPSSVKGLRGFLGLSVFYGKFIRNYAGIAQPLTALLKKDSFHWSESAQDAFDLLSHEEQCMALPVPHHTFLEDLKQDLATDGVFKSLCERLATDPASLPGFRLHEGLLFRHNRIWEVQDFIKQCTICQQTKYSTLKPAGLLQPLALPTNVWEDISMDFVTGLPPSQGFSVLFVVVDRFIKGIHLGAFASGFTAYKVAELFVSIFCKHHGLPKSIVSDRDPIFISHFWKDLFKFSVEQYLRAFVHDKPSHWVCFLSWAEFHYNTSVHSVSGVTPYQVTYGKPPPSIPSYIPGSSVVDACDQTLEAREELLAQLQKNLMKAQKQMKLGADKHRRDIEFAVNSWVYVKLQPYRQV